MPASETVRHLELKRLALGWAVERGFRVAATEVAVPNVRAVLDVAGCRIESRAPAGGVTATAVFECKQSRADFIRDSRSRSATVARLAELDAKRLRHETMLRPYYLSLRHGDSLFAELDGCDFIRTGDELYLRLLAEIERLTTRLYAQTKFDNLRRWGAANLFYLVAEPDLFRSHELPAGWGLLVRTGERLVLAKRPIWHEIAAAKQLTLLQRTAIAATRSAQKSASAPALKPSAAPVAEPLAKEEREP